MKILELVKIAPLCPIKKGYPLQECVNFCYGISSKIHEVAQLLLTILTYGYYYTFEYDDLSNKITNWSTTKINYKAIKHNLDKIYLGSDICFREALAQECFHPKNMDKWIGWGQEDDIDFIGME